MTTAIQRVFVVWFSTLDRWVVPSSVIRADNLPAGWRVVRVGSLVRKFWEKTKVAPGTDYTMLGVKWYGQGTFQRETVRGDSLSAAYVAPILPGALIYNRLFAWKGSFAVAPPEHKGCFVSGEFPQFIVDETQVLSQYLYLYFTSSAALKTVNAASVGSAAVSRNRFKEEAFLALEIPLPSLAVQQAVQAEWQKARQEIAAAEERIRKIEREIEEGFFAELGLKPPSQAEVPKCFAVPWKKFSRWSVNFNQTALMGMDITRGKYPVVELGSVLSVAQYGTSEKANTQGKGVPVLRINNIKNRSLDLSDLKYIDLAGKTLQSLLLQDGDILIIRTSGSRDLVGTCAVFHDAGTYAYASYLIRMRTDPHRANPDFVSWFINSAIGRQQINAISRQIMQNNINSEELRSLRIPLPPLDVQRRIVADVEAGRARIASEREKARVLSRQIEADVEAYLLGTKKVGTN